MPLILGTSGDDNLTAHTSDVVRGLGGNDQIDGTDGFQSYEYALGDGHDTITESFFTGVVGGNYLDLFGVSFDDTVFYRVPNAVDPDVSDLLVGFRTAPGSIRILDQDGIRDGTQFFASIFGYTFTPDLDYVRDGETDNVDRVDVTDELRDLPVVGPALTADRFSPISPAAFYLFGNDTPLSDDPYYITAVNGDAMAVDTPIITSSGANLWIGWNGRVDYDASAVEASLQPGDVRRDHVTYSAGHLDATVPGLGGPTSDSTLDLYFGYDLDADFFGETLASAGFLDAAGDERLVNLHTAGDRDRFAVLLEQGAEYQFDWRGETSDAGTLFDPFLRLYDAAGGSLGSDDDGGAVEFGFRDSRITFTAPDTGIYQIEVAGYDDDYAGIGLLSVEQIGQPPEAKDDAFTVLPLATTIVSLLNDNGNGADTGSGLSVTSVNGLSIGSERTISLDSGAKITVFESGILAYVPGLAELGNVLSPSFVDSFVYEITDDNGVTDTATAEVTVDLSDAIFGTSGDEALFNGTSGDDFIILGAGRDAVRSRGGDDVILGGDGLDRLNGLGGNNTLIGGADNDVFQFQGPAITPGATTEIVDLDFSEGDQIALIRFGDNYFDDTVNPGNSIKLTDNDGTARINSLDDIEEIVNGGRVTIADDAGRLRLDFDDLAGDPYYSILLSNLASDVFA